MSRGFWSSGTGSAEFGFTCFKCVVVRNRLPKSIKFQKSNSSTSVNRTIGSGHKSDVPVVEWKEPSKDTSYYNCYNG
jgi:hypothetical protein